MVEEYTLKMDLDEMGRQFSALPKNLNVEKESNVDWVIYEDHYKMFFASAIPKISAIELQKADSYQAIIEKLVTNEYLQGNLKNKITVAPEMDSNNIEPFIFEELPHDPVRSVSNDDTNKDMLYNKELQDCILEGEFDIIGFDACLMSMLETAYCLNTRCQYIIGSEELEPGTGWNHTLWLSDLASDPNISARFLAKSIIDSYRKTYQYLPSVTLSCIDIETVSVLTGQVNELAKQLLLNYSQENNNVTQARNMCLKYAMNKPSIQSIDLYLFIYHLERLSSSIQVKETCARIMAIINTMVVENFASGDMDFYPDRESFGSKGIAIYFPKRKEYFDADYSDANKNYPIQFVKDTQWDLFLQTYYNTKTN
jgi:hypothetical protein